MPDDVTENGEAGVGDGGTATGQTNGGPQNSEPPAGEGAGQGDGGAGESGGDNELPESYELNLGEGVELSDEDRAAYSDLFREWGLSQEQVDQLGELEANIGQQLQERASNELSETMEGWLEEAQADPEIGGDNWDETMAHATVAMKAVGSDDFAELLTTTGLGNHPALIKAFSTLGKFLGDDNFTTGGASDETVDAASSWYGDTTPSSKKG